MGKLSQLEGDRLMIIRYSSIAIAAMEQIRQMNENEFHSLRGLIILLSTAHSRDDRDKIEMDFGGGLLMLVYMGLDWWIVYQIEDAEETLYIAYIDAT